MERCPKWLSLEKLKESSRASGYFKSPAAFTRWLLNESCNEAELQAPLLVGWREAKPCLQAIQAFLSGDTSGLRPDGGRAELPQRDDGALVRVPVDDVVILVGSYQKHCVMEWIKENGNAYGVDLHVVPSLRCLGRVLANISSKKHDMAAAGAGRQDGLPMPPSLQPMCDHPELPAPTPLGVPDCHGPLSGSRDPAEMILPPPGLAPSPPLPWTSAPARVLLRSEARRVPDSAFCIPPTCEGGVASQQDVDLFIKQRVLHASLQASGSYKLSV